MTVLDFPKSDANPFGIRRWPLGRSAQCAEVVFSITNAAADFGLPQPTTQTVCRLPDSRYVVTEVSGTDAVCVGEAVSLIEAMDLALATIADPEGQVARAPMTTHALAMVMLALIGEGARRSPQFPVARGAS